MNIFNLIIGVFILARLVGKFIDGYGDKETQMPITPNFNQRRRRLILYNYSNEHKIHASLLVYYTKMLNLNNESEINLDVVNNHY